MCYKIIRILWLIWTHKSRKPVFYYSISNWVLHIIPHNYPPTQFNLLYPNRAIRCLPFMKKPVSIPPYTAIMQISTKHSRHDVQYRNIKSFFCHHRNQRKISPHMWLHSGMIQLTDINTELHCTAHTASYNVMLEL